MNIECYYHPNLFFLLPHFSIELETCDHCDHPHGYTITLGWFVGSIGFFTGECE
jgi:hypothetical protein